MKCNLLLEKKKKKRKRKKTVSTAQSSQRCYSSHQNSPERRANGTSTSVWIASRLGILCCFPTRFSHPYRGLKSKRLSNSI